MMTDTGLAGKWREPLSRLRQATSLTTFNQEFDSIAALYAYLVSLKPPQSADVCEKMFHQLLPAAHQGLLLFTQQAQSTQATSSTALPVRTLGTVSILLKAVAQCIEALISFKPRPLPGIVGKAPVTESGFIGALDEAASVLAVLSPATLPTAAATVAAVDTAAAVEATAARNQKVPNWRTENGLDVLSIGVLDVWFYLASVWPEAFLVSNDPAVAAPNMAKLGLCMLYHNSSSNGSSSSCLSSRRSTSNNTARSTTSTGTVRGSQLRHLMTEAISDTGETAAIRVAEVIAVTLNEQMDKIKEARDSLTISNLSLLMITLYHAGTDIRMLLLCALAHATAAAWQAADGRLPIQQHSPGMTSQSSSRQGMQKSKQQPQTLQVAPYHEQLMQTLKIAGLQTETSYEVIGTQTIPATLVSALTDMGHIVRLMTKQQQPSSGRHGVDSCSNSLLDVPVIPLQLQAPFMLTVLELLLLHQDFPASATCRTVRKLVCSLDTELEPATATDILQDIVCLLVPVASHGCSVKSGLAAADAADLVGAAEVLLVKADCQSLAAKFVQQPAGCCMLLEAVVRMGASKAAQPSAEIILHMLQLQVETMFAGVTTAAQNPRTSTEAATWQIHLFSLLTSCVKAFGKDTAALASVSSLDVAEVAMAVAVAFGGSAADGLNSSSSSKVSVAGRGSRRAAGKCTDSSSSGPDELQLALWMAVVAKGIYNAASMLQQSQQQQQAQQAGDMISLLQRFQLLLDWLHSWSPGSHVLHAVTGRTLAVHLQAQYQTQTLKVTLQQAKEPAQQLQSATHAGGVRLTAAGAAETAASTSHTVSQSGTCLQDDTFLEVARQTQAYTAAVLAQLPLVYCCGNIACTRLEQASELQLASAKGTRCSKCQLVRFCCKECQLAAWPLHKPVCKALRNAASTAV